MMGTKRENVSIGPWHVKRLSERATKGGTREGLHKQEDDELILIKLFHCVTQVQQKKSTCATAKNNQKGWERPPRKNLCFRWQVYFGGAIRRDRTFNHGPSTVICQIWIGQPVLNLPSSAIQRRLTRSHLISTRSAIISFLLAIV